MIDSLRRGLPRIVLLAAIGMLLLLLSFAPELLGVRGGAWPALVPLFLESGRVFLGLAAGDLALRILQPKVDAQSAAQAAIDIHTTGPALVYLARNLLAAVILVLMVSAARAEEPPAVLSFGYGQNDRLQRHLAEHLAAVHRLHRGHLAPRAELLSARGTPGQDKQVPGGAEGARSRRIQLGGRA